MAYYPHSLILSLFLFFSILISITQITSAGREVPKTVKDTDRKQPEFFFGHDGSFLIPGVGRVMVPSYGGYPSTDPGYLGGGGDNGIGAGGENGGYIPGGDDTFVPNPGYEVPNPGFDVPNPAVNTP